MNYVNVNKVDPLFIEATNEIILGIFALASKMGKIKNIKTHCHANIVSFNT